MTVPGCHPGITLGVLRGQVGGAPHRRRPGPWRRCFMASLPGRERRGAPDVNFAMDPRLRRRGAVVRYGAPASGSAQA